MADAKLIATFDSAAGADPESLLSAPPLFIDLLPVAAFACDSAGRIRWANSKAIALWGRAPGEADASAFLSAAAPIVSPGGLVAKAENAAAFTLRTGEAAEGRIESFTRPDGERVTVSVRTNPLRGATGATIGVLACFHEAGDDFGAYGAARESERRLHEILSALPAGDAPGAPGAARESERRLHEILNALPAAIYTTDAEGRIDYYNEAAAEMSGRRPELGRDSWCVTWKLYTADGEPLPHDQCPMAVSLREDVAIRGVEAVAERPDGSRIPFIPYPTPLHDSEGRLVGAVNMLVDISQRKEAESRQKLLFSELNHRVSNNMQMLHALLTAGIRETADPTARSALSDAAARVAAMSAAQLVLYESERLTRFDSGRFIRSVCATARQATGANIGIETDCEAGELGNDLAVPLALILNELLTNAARHSADETGRADVRVSLGKEGDRHRLTVEDRGPGFDLRDVRRRSSGLGLVAGLARQIGGGFIVKRQEGKGARCIVRFRDAA